MRVKVFRIYIVLAALAGVIAPAQAAIYYVATDGDGTNPSNSWATAATNIQTAINLATNSGDQVCVKQGTYNITNQLALTSANSGVELLGGYVGSGMPGNRTNDPSLTVINAGGKCRVINCTGVSTGTISGFTIKGGSLGYPPDNNGGGINLVNSSPTIINNIITANYANWPGGGGIACSGSSPIIMHNRIVGNRSGGYGGGIYIVSGAPNIVNNLILCNVGSETWVSGSGGGIYGGGASTVIRNNTFLGNISSVNQAGGGIASCAGTIRDCIFLGNADDLAGASATYSCIEDGDTGTGNISANPLFVNGYYLSQTNAEQASQSPCVDSGSQSAAAAGLSARTTRSDGWNDAGTVDMGYHGTGATPAVTIYVSNSGTNAGAGTIAAPWKNIGYALTNVGEGSTINVFAGTYNTNSGETFPLNIRVDGITLQGAGWTNCIIDATGSGQRVITCTYVAVVKIDGFKITGGSAPAADWSGGGIRLVRSSPTISHNLITGNYAAYYGGGIYADFSNCTLANNRIIRNIAGESAGGVVFVNNGSANIINNVMADNTANTAWHATSGGGIRGGGSLTIVRNNTIAGNTGDVAGIYFCSGTIKNCILWNKATELSGTPNVTYSCVKGGYAGVGNITNDPKFVNPAGDDYHLKSGAGTWNGSGWTRYPGQNSPGIDAGDPASDYANEPQPNGRRINMGAYGNTSEASKTLSKGTIFVIY